MLTKWNIVNIESLFFFFWGVLYSFFFFRPSIFLYFIIRIISYWIFFVSLIFFIKKAQTKGKLEKMKKEERGKSLLINKKTVKPYGARDIELRSLIIFPTYLCCWNLFFLFFCEIFFNDFSKKSIKFGGN